MVGIHVKTHMKASLSSHSSETAKLNELKTYYYFKHLLTELPNCCDENGNIEPADLDYLMPWSESLPAECRKQWG
jgi:transposase